MRLLTGLALAAALAASPALAAKDLVIGMEANSPHLDPSNTNDTLSQSIERMFYQGLIGFDKEMKLIPALATSWEANAAATEYVFHLRSGVLFHDGTKFDAAAVKVNIERLANPDNRLTRRILVSMLKSVEIIDPLTVKITLNEPFGAFLNNIAHPGTFMISPAALAKYGKDIGQNPVGTGPYKFVSYRTDTIKAEKNPTYWRAGYPKVDTVTWTAVPEAGARFAKLKTGEAQFIYSLPPELVRVAEADPAIQVIQAPSIIARYLSLNNLKKPYSDLRVRQALNYAIDKNAFVKVVFSGYGEPLDAPIPPNLAFHATQGPWPYDPAKAKALLAEAGYPNGFETEIWGGVSTLARRGMEFIQQQLAQVGVKVTVVPMESGLLSQKTGGMQTPEEVPARLHYTGWSASTGDADWGLRPLLYSKSFPPNLFNTTYYASKETDGLIEAALVTADPAVRGAVYAKAQAQIWKDAPWVFLSVDKLLAGQSKKLSGVYYIPDGGVLTEEADLK
jgi:glutathione transport system substrate-binding protein